jgi:hypothetical protein
VTVGNTTLTLAAPGDSTIIAPNTSNFQGGNANLGYTAILSDSDVATLQVAQPVLAGVSPTVPRFIGDAEAAQTISAVGFSFNIVAKQQLVSDVSATITIIGNETGGRSTINLTVKKTQLATAVSTELINAVPF